MPKLELVKDYSKIGDISYYITEDDKYVSGSASRELTDALDFYYRIKKNYTEARTEILLSEEF